MHIQETGDSLRQEMILVFSYSYKNAIQKVGKYIARPVWFIKYNFTWKDKFRINLLSESHVLVFVTENKCFKCPDRIVGETG